MDKLDSREDPQVAVELAARTHGIYMGTGHYRRKILEAFPEADYVADLVDADLETEFAHP